MSDSIKKIVALRQKEFLSIADVINGLESLNPCPDIGGLTDGFVDKSDAHEYADLLLLDALRLSGRQDVVDAYESVKNKFDGFWYG